MARLSNEDKWLLRSEAIRIRYRERLELMNDLAVLSDDPHARDEYRRNLAAIAFADDPKTKAIVFEALTRVRR